MRKQVLTELELRLMSRAAASGSVCPKDAEEKEVMADLLRRALLRCRFWSRRGAAQLTIAGWAVLDDLYDDDWAN
jgi:hypothetical protein